MKNLVGLRIPIIALLCISLLLLFTCRTKRQSDKQLALMQDSMRYWYNSAGQEVAAKEAVNRKYRDLQIKFNLDSVAGVFDLKKGSILSYVNLQAKGKTTLRPVAPATHGISLSDNWNYAPTFVDRPSVYPRVDNIADVTDGPGGYMEQEFSSPYFKAKVRVGDSAYLQLDSYDTLSLVQARSYERYGFLNLQRRGYVDTRVISANPDEKLYISKAARIADLPDPWLVIGPSFGYGYGIGQPARFFVGLTATVPLIILRKH